MDKFFVPGKQHIDLTALLSEGLNSDTLFLAAQELAKVEKRKEALKKHPYTVTALPDGRWQTYVTGPDGKRRLVRRKDRDALDDALADYYDGASRKTTLAAVYERWIADRRIVRSPGTLIKDRWIWATYFDGTALAGTDVKTLRRAPLQAAMMAISDAHGLTRRQYSEPKGLLNSVLDYAIDEGILATNPARAFVRVSADRFADPAPAAVRDKIIPPADRELIIDYCRKMYAETDNTAYLGIILDFCLGLRVGELVALRFEDFDVAAMTLTVSRSERSHEPGKPGGRYVVREGLKKGHARREIGIGPDVLALVSEIRESYADRGIVTDWLLVDGSGDRRTKGEIDCTMARVNRALGLPMRSIHSIRKTLLTVLIASQALSLREVQEIAGHTDPSTTLRFYAADIADRAEQGRRIAAVAGIQQHSNPGQKKEPGKPHKH